MGFQELAETLRQWNEDCGRTEGDITEYERESDVAAELDAVFQEREAKLKERHQSYASIPTFFVKKSSPDDALRAKFRREVRTRFLEQKSQQLLDNSDVDRLWALLLKHKGKPHDTQDRITYEAFCQVKEELPTKCHEFFVPSMFLLFERDQYGRIPIVPFFNAVMRKVSLYQTRISLSFYDAEGYGYLREQDLENYIFELIPSLPQLGSLEESFFTFYVCTAVRKICFFLDPKRKGRILIKDLLASRILLELFELREEHLPDRVESSNWFSARSALRVYGQYLNLDVDHNGMLSRDELSRYGTGGLTPEFLKCIFQEYHTYENEMDYKTFLDFVLAMENKNTPEALAYFFRALDIRKCGYLTCFDINYFFRGILRGLHKAGHDIVLVEDVKDEIFDMVKPKHPLHITLQDLIDCSVGDTVVKILIDVNGFWSYDNREALLQSEEDDQ